jgi:hypothetical protein
MIKLEKMTRKPLWPFFFNIYVLLTIIYSHLRQERKDVRGPRDVVAALAKFQNTCNRLVKHLALQL